MFPDRWRAAVLVSAAVLVGCTAWSGDVLALPLAVLFPALWAWSPNQAVAAAVAAGYFLAASRGLPHGVAAYFGASVWAGILLWFAASVAFVAVHAVLWTRRTGLIRPAHYAIAAVLMAVPPFGITGWAHPITAAGVLFPSWGWWGLGATGAALLVMTTKFWPVAVVLALGVWGWSTASWITPPPPDGWQGVSTAMSASLGRGSALDQHRILAGMVRDRAAAGAEVVVLPESAIGTLTPTVAQFWTEGLAGLNVTVVAGAVVIDRQGYDNVMIGLGASGASVLYRARMPVPVSMWQPWRAWFGMSGGARATFFSDAIVEILGRQVVPLICYEQLIVWPILQSALHRPDAIVAIGNGWWAAGTSVPAIQRASTEAWARLFDLPLVIAFNR